MVTFQLRKPILLTAMAACTAVCALPNIVFADDAQDIQALKEQVRQMQQKPRFAEQFSDGKFTTEWSSDGSRADELIDGRARRGASVRRHRRSLGMVLPCTAQWTLALNT